MGIERFIESMHGMLLIDEEVPGVAKMMPEEHGPFVRYSDHLRDVAEAEARGRRQGLEKAAKVAETRHGYPTELSEAIRALISEDGK